MQKVCTLLTQEYSVIYGACEPTQRLKLLESLQMVIESSTSMFDEKSIYSSSMGLFDKLTNNRTDNMKNRLISAFKESPSVLESLGSLDVYTVEILVIYALGLFFNKVWQDDPYVKASAFIDKIGRLIVKDSVVSKNGRVVDRCSINKVEVDPVVCNQVGGKVFGWLLEKNLVKIVDNPSEKKKAIKSTSGEYYSKSSHYVRCNYDCNLLPVRLNLPMVVPPKPWELIKKEVNGTLFEYLDGGYLTDSADVYYRYSLVSSKDFALFKLLLDLKNK